MNRSKGMTVIEIIIALGIGGSVLLIAISLLFFSVQNYNSTNSKIEARKIGSALAHNLIRVFSFSNGIITRSGVNISTNIALNQPGELRLGSWTDISSHTPGSMVAIANLRRETGAGLAVAGNRFSSYRSTGIFYVLPTPTTSGVLFFDMGDQATMTASYGDLYFDRITELEIDRPQYVTVNGIQYLKSFHIRVGVRHFLTAEKSLWRWCPQSDITAGVANCAPRVSYKDFHTDLNIVIPNQIVRIPSAVNNLLTAERILGSVYFFPFLD